MSGHMGHEQMTTLNLEVVESDPERGLFLVKGSVPGPHGGVVVVRNAVKALGGRKAETMAEITLKTAAGTAPAPSPSTTPRSASSRTSR